MFLLKSSKWATVRYPNDGCSSIIALIGSAYLPLDLRSCLGRSVIDSPTRHTEPLAQLADRNLESVFLQSLADRVDLLSSVVLVEHDMPFVMNLAGRLVVINFGEHIASGSPREVQANPVVQEAYLGAAA